MTRERGNAERIPKSRSTLHLLSIFLYKISVTSVLFQAKHSWGDKNYCNCFFLACFYFYFGFVSFFFGSLTSDSFHNFNITLFHSPNEDSSYIFLSELATVILSCQVKLASCFKSHKLLD